MDKDLNIMDKLNGITFLTKQLQTNQRSIEEKEREFWQKCLILIQKTHEYHLIFDKYGTDFDIKIHTTSALEYNKVDIHFDIHNLNKFGVPIPESYNNREYGYFNFRILLDINNNIRDVIIADKYHIVDIIADEKLRNYCFNGIKWLTDSIPTIANAIISMVYTDLQIKVRKTTQTLNSILEIAKKQEPKEDR